MLGIIKNVSNIFVLIGLRRQAQMRNGSIITHTETSCDNPIGEVKVTSDESVIMRAIAKLTADWYPNEYHFISEEFFKHLLALSRLVTKNTQ
jgi:hypothetical protein